MNRSFWVGIVDQCKARLDILIAKMLSGPSAVAI